MTHLSSQPVILLIDVHLPAILSNPQLLLLAHLPNFPVVPLVAQGCSGGEKEGAGDHGGDEGKAEEGEGVTFEGTAVGCADGVLVGRRTKLFGLEGWHCRKG